MIKYLKILYNFLMKLKKYHAMHILIIPPASFFIVTYSMIWIWCLADWDFVFPGLGILILFIAAIYYCILFCSAIIAILAAIIIFIKQKHANKKINVHSQVLLKNRFYNCIFFISLIHYFLLLTTTCCKCYYYYFAIYLFPIYYLSFLFKKLFS